MEERLAKEIVQIDNKKKKGMSLFENSNYLNDFVFDIEKVRQKGLSQCLTITNLLLDLQIPWDIDCVCCGHSYLQKLDVQNVLDSLNEKDCEEYEEMNIKAVKEGPKPRIKKRHMMRYQCGCKAIFGSNCPSCGGEDFDSCEICNCQCSVGPFVKSQMGLMSSQVKDRKHGIPADADLRQSMTTAINRSLFGSVLANSLDVSAVEH